MARALMVKREQLIRDPIPRVVATLLTVVCLGLVSQVAGQSVIETLKPGASIKRDLKKGELHSYRIELDAGQCFHAVIDQDGIAVAIRIYGAGGKLLAEGSGHHRGERRIFFVAQEPGDYRLQVTAADENVDAPGHYELKIVELRSATDDDRSRYAAQESFAQAARLGSPENATSQTRGTMLERYQEALGVWRKLDDRKGETDALLAMGTVNVYLDRPRSVEDFNQALAISRVAGDRWSEEIILEDLGDVVGEMGETDRALEALLQSLAIARELKDNKGEALSLYSIALFYMSLGEAQAALDYNQQLLKITRPEENHALPLHSLCKNYLLLGESQSALDYCRQASSVWRATGKRLFEAATLAYIGKAYSFLGESQKELEYYHQALNVFREVADRQGEAFTLNDIGSVYQLQGDHQRALDCFEQAQILFHALPNPEGESITLRLTGQVYWSLSENEKALDYFNQALSLQRSLKDRSNEAATLLAIARSERDLGQLTEARREIEAALSIVESLSGRVTALDLRASYLSTKREYYEFYVDLLMHLDALKPNVGYAAQAFQTSERARARSFVDSLAEAGIDLHQGVAANLIAREHAIRQQLSFKSKRLTQLLAGNGSPEEVAAAQREIDELLLSYDAVEAEIKIQNPSYASLEHAQASSLQDVQEKLIDQDTILIEYSLGEERSFVWMVTPTSFTSFELPRRSIIEAAARRVYELLTARSKTLPNERPEQKQKRVERADAEYASAASELSQMLLGPIASSMSHKRLLIVAEGALEYVPFAALPVPKNETGQRNFHPLVVDHEIVSLPSASVLTALRSEAPRRQVATKTLAVLADPVFDSNDPRIPGARKGKTVASKDKSLSDALRSAEESGLTSFERLRFSRAEAEAISLPVPADQKLKAVDFVANRATATSPDLGQYRIVHFATHGLINSRHPELSGIVLSLVDDKGQSRDGFLRLYEIYNLKLNADLVVLSACQTALGKEIKGEGLIGLTRGFMYAGAPRVVASLWRIDDHATAELMKRFYQGMLGRQKLSAAAALRAAQVEMWKEKGWENPYFWAFTLQGEWP